MTPLEQVERALIKADAAGDTPSATVLAGEVRRLRDLSAGEPSVETATAPSGYVLPRLGQAVAAPFMGATAVAKGLANTGIGVAQLAAAGIGHGTPEAVDRSRNRRTSPARTVALGVSPAASAFMRARSVCSSGVIIYIFPVCH